MPQTAGLFPQPPAGIPPRPPGRGSRSCRRFTLAKIAVEVDGGYYHLNPEQYRRDRRRDWLYQRHGYLVLRFLAEDVVVELESVLNTILEAAARRCFHSTSRCYVSTSALLESPRSQQAKLSLADLVLPPVVAREEEHQRGGSSQRHCDLLPPRSAA